MVIRRMFLPLVIAVTLQFGLAGEPVGSLGAITSAASRHSATQENPSLPLLAGSNCSCGNITIVCSAPTSYSDYWIPWASCICSILLFVIPAGRRIWNLRPDHLGLRHSFFSWSLMLGFAVNILWCHYCFPCIIEHTAYPMWVTSIAGAIIHPLLLLWSSVKIPTNLSGTRLKVMCTVGIISFVIGASVAGHDAAAIGWLSAGLSVMYHCFRIQATNYDNFDGVLFCASLFGALSGLLWLHHPSLCVATQYKSASLFVAVIRGVEVFRWSAPWIGSGLTKVEGTETVGYDKWD